MIRKVIIAGSRTVFPSVEEIDAAIAKLDPSGLLWVPAEWTHVISGRSKGGGADIAGEAWARARGKEILPFPVTDEHVRRFGPYLAPKMRNRDMAEVGEAALIFWDGKSGGSADMCTRMVARHKPVEVIPWAPRKRERGPARRGVGRGRSKPPPGLAEMIAEQRSYIYIGERLNVSPLQTTLAAAQSETAKVQAAIDALTPPPAP